MPSHTHIIGRDIRERWQLEDYTDWYWLPKPTTIRILMYADGGVKFSGGSFDGLTHVLSTLQSDPYFWVTFDITTVHRHGDPSADHDFDTLDDYDLVDDFDEVWLFGIASGDILSSSEKTALETFMDQGGGVLVTGDHASLGEGIAGHIKRAGKLRKYPAPPASEGVWNNTLREGPTPGYVFPDQSDDTPQNIRLKWYTAFHLYSLYMRIKYPHPVLCGPNGPIDVFPDHQHEGEINIPNSYPSNEWPSKDGFQPKPEAIAWGRIVDPDSDQGREFPIVGVYDGQRADVGRIVADSTWHHWFDINLKGFPATPSGLAALQQIEAYFLNVAIWLAPKVAQNSMWASLSWGALWRDPLVMLDTRQMHIYHLGSQAKDAFGQFAPQCQVNTWLWDFVIPELRLPLEELIGPTPDPPFILPVEDLIMGAAMETLLQRYREQEDIVDEFPGVEAMQEPFQHAVHQGLRTYLRNYEEFGEKLHSLKL